MIRIMARITSKPESVNGVCQAFEALVPPTRREPGCISYELFQSEDNPVEFVTIEAWADQAAAEVHLTTPHIAEVFA